MGQHRGNTPIFAGRNVLILSLLLVAVGVSAFVFQLAGRHPELAWQAYLVNFLLWSGIAQGGLLFSTVMHLTQAKWPGPLNGLSESFAGFFPVSFLLFLLLFLGRAYVFPWQSHELHGKEVWLNLPFLFTRDTVGLVILYALGFVYLYHTLQFKMINGPDKAAAKKTGILRRFLAVETSHAADWPEKIQRRITISGALYITAFVLVLSLLGYDLVMSADPHWVSTLFGAYTFVKAVYVGFGALIILASIFYLTHGKASGLTPAHFHDLGKLYFAFCLLWADFFYVQFLVIWYGNIPEETSYIIHRTMMPPWNHLAWTVFIVCFVIPFFILLNKTVKTKPVYMIVLASFCIVGMCLEHFLLLGPALSPHAVTLPLGVTDALIFLGFLGLMIFAVKSFLNIFPELLISEDDFKGQAEGVD